MQILRILHYCELFMENNFDIKAAGPHFYERAPTDQSKLGRNQKKGDEQ